MTHSGFLLRPGSGGGGPAGTSSGSGSTTAGAAAAAGCSTTSPPSPVSAGMAAGAGADAPPDSAAPPDSPPPGPARPSASRRSRDLRRRCSGTSVIPRRLGGPRGRQEGPRGSQGANTDVTAFIASLVVLAMMVGIVFLVGIKRKPGTPTTWGEAFIAATFVFAILLMIYGIVPDRWLRWADGELKWRSDKIGIPTGPISHFHFWFIKIQGHLLWPQGLTFGGRGRIQSQAEG